VYPVSQFFLDELRQPHTVVAKSEFWFQGELRDTVQMLGGQVTEDATAAIRRRASLVYSSQETGLVLPAATWSAGDASQLWPVGWEVRVFSGVRYSNGFEEYAPCGVYRISKPVITNAVGQGSTVTVDAYDRSRQISRARFTDAYDIADGTDVATAIRDLLKNRLPVLADSDFNFIRTDGLRGGPVYTTPHIIFLPQDDPWEGAMGMAKSIGCELLFDAAGKPVLRYQPDPVFTPSVFDYMEGEANIMGSISRSLDDEQAYNGVIAVGNNADLNGSIPRGEAWDLDVKSPTYYNPLNPGASQYGPVPYFMASDYITDNEQADGAANGQLVRVLGILEGVDFGAIGNPAHEAGDVVRIVDSTTNVDGNYLLESYSFTLGHAGTTNGTTRKRRLL
jgi:hypothetical protein